MTWLELPADHPYGVANLPYCAFRFGCFRSIGVRIGDHVLNLSGLESEGLIDAAGSLEGETTVNRLMASGRPTWVAVRRRLQELLTEARHRPAVEPLLFPLTDVGLELPFDVADYVDFYCFEHHASNVGKMFRPGQPPLLPNWKRLPVGYHGRSGTVVVSGTDVVRPCGQRRGDQDPVFGPSVRLDIEAEVGFVVGTDSALGERVPAAEFAEYVFGIVLLNDWSARDIQAWEYVPLGPFLGKSFATSISPWVVPLDALAAAEVDPPVQDPPPLDYLTPAGPGYDLRLSVTWNDTLVAEPPFREMYWTAAQQVAHLTVNGASLRTGDLYASGTVSGPGKRQRGSFLELTWSGEEPVMLADGSVRTFLEDGDTVTISGTAAGPNGAVIGLGEVTGQIQPANPYHRLGV